MIFYATHFMPVSKSQLSLENHRYEILDKIKESKLQFSWWLAMLVDQTFWISEEKIKNLINRCKWLFRVLLISSRIVSVLKEKVSWVCQRNSQLSMAMVWLTH